MLIARLAATTAAAASSAVLSSSSFTSLSLLPPLASPSLVVLGAINSHSVRPPAPPSSTPGVRRYNRKGGYRNTMGSSQSSHDPEGGTATSAESSPGDGDEGGVSPSAATAAMEDASSDGGEGPDDGRRTALHSRASEPTPRHAHSPVKTMAHYIFLVHGWMGNDLEMAYLSGAFENIIYPSRGEEEVGGGPSEGPDPKRAKRSGSQLTQLLLAQAAAAASEDDKEDAPAEIVVHSVKCNVGKTRDGIKNGGIRLAEEMVSFIRSDVEKRLQGSYKDGNDGEVPVVRHVTYSMVGNSLGGLYSRYGVSLVPLQLQIKPRITLNLHPNIFCTTATPHLGVSRHTYLPLPRVAEAIIGTGMGITGRDLFRLDSEKDLASAAAQNVVEAAVGGVNLAVGGVVGAARRISAPLLKSRSEGGILNGSGASAFNTEDEDSDEEIGCVIRSMCLQERFLTPLRRFRRRIAYANAYGTDFQVPTPTAAFLHERSGVRHFVVASRDPALAKEEGGGEGALGVELNQEKGEKSEGENREEGKREGVPPFIVAIVRTEGQPQSHSPAGSDLHVSPADELLRMSQSLDALGWTKVFIDVRDRIPAPRLAKPLWLKSAHSPLEDLIEERSRMTFDSLQGPAAAVATGTSPLSGGEGEVILTSQELAQSTFHGDSIDFPLGHTVMIANSKSEGYSRMNSRGRPVMDGLAENLVEGVLEFE